MSSHKIDWILTELLLLTLSCLLYCMVSSLLDALEGECLCKQVVCSVVINCFVYPVFFILYFVVAWLLLYPVFYTNAVAIFLFIRWSCKQAYYFCFKAFLYHFKNTISIFVKIYCRIKTFAAHCIHVPVQQCTRILELLLFILWKRVNKCKFDMETTQISSKPTTNNFNCFNA